MSKVVLVLALLSPLLLLSSCRSTTVETKTKVAEPVKDGNAIANAALGKLRTQTYRATVNISKVFKRGEKFDDVLHVYSRVEDQDRFRVLISIKPQLNRKASGILAELRNRTLVFGYRLIPETQEVVTISPKRNLSNLVIGGLSLQDFQMVQGVFPFSETRLAGTEEVNGKLCDALDIVFRDQSEYHHGKFFTTVADRLPVLMRAYNKEGATVKEIVFDKLERVGAALIVKQLTVTENNFNYTSTFHFEDVQLNIPIDDAIFSVEFLQKGWQQSL